MRSFRHNITRIFFPASTVVALRTDFLTNLLYWIECQHMQTNLHRPGEDDCWVMFQLISETVNSMNIFHLPAFLLAWEIPIKKTIAHLWVTQTWCGVDLNNAH